jgi:hypothetical protein
LSRPRVRRQRSDEAGSSVFEFQTATFGCDARRAARARDAGGRALGGARDFIRMWGCLSETNTTRHPASLPAGYLPIIYYINPEWFNVVNPTNVDDGISTLLELWSQLKTEEEENLSPMTYRDWHATLETLAPMDTTVRVDPAGDAAGAAADTELDRVVGCYIWEVSCGCNLT